MPQIQLMAQPAFQPVGKAVGVYIRRPREWSNSPLWTPPPVSARIDRITSIQPRCVCVPTIKAMNSIYHNARFLLGAPDLRHLPPDTSREVAFAGRSNAGKSSAINAITGQKALARTSKTPGRTQQINVFPVSDGCYLIDLPGYGFAKLPQAIRAHWQRTLPEYLQRRRSLRGLMLVMDVRHPLTVLDQQLLAECTHAGLPVHVLLTKADKLKQGPAARALRSTIDQLAQDHPGASVQLFSALRHRGIEAVHRKLDGWLELGTALRVNPENTTADGLPRCDATLSADP